MPTLLGTFFCLKQNENVSTDMNDIEKKLYILSNPIFLQ